MKKIELRLNQVSCQYCILTIEYQTSKDPACTLEKIRLDMTLDVKRAARITHRFIGDGELMSNLIIR